MPREIIDLLLKNGATDALFVGGSVRDEILANQQSVDEDIEVYGLGYDKIVKILRSAKYNVGLVGKSFGTVKVGNNIDINIPRRESKCGIGHRGFSIEPDPSMTPFEAASRRDYTINAIAKRLDGTYFDPYGGIEDLKKGVLRATSEAFADDPLRVLRGMQFAARFGFHVEPNTLEMCRKLKSEFSTLSPERIWGEWKKWAALGKYPSYGLRVLQQTQWIEFFPEVFGIVGVQQNPLWHTEGDVFEHTCLVCDAAAKLADSLSLPEEERIILLLGALCHDFGKAKCTALDENGVWRSPGHAKFSTPLAKTFLDTMRCPHHIVTKVCRLAGEHMALISIPDHNLPTTEPSETVVRRLANRLHPTNIRMWAILSQADGEGCGKATPASHVVRHSVQSWKRVAARLGLENGPPKPIVQGRDLIPLGMPADESLGKILAKAFEAQLDGLFSDLENGIQWVLANEDFPKKFQNTLTILTIESTCDETAAAVVTDELKILGSVVASQDFVHQRYGGVVPEIASRCHLEHIVPVIDETLKRSGITLHDLDAIAVANTPGLAGSLLVGLTAAKALCVALDKPLIAVNHLQAHIYACRIAAQQDVFPCLGLIISGGHTSLYRCQSAIDFSLLGGTIDDAVGETFDKVAAMLGLPYPGGPSVQKAAENGNPKSYDFPRPMLNNAENIVFSFSGLKTAVRYLIFGTGKIDRSSVPELSESEKANIAASFQEAAVDCLVGKTLQALKQTKANTLCVGGGVAANKRFREKMQNALESKNVRLFIAPLNLCTDNAVMGAIAIERFKAGLFESLDLDVIPS